MLSSFCFERAATDSRVNFLTFPVRAKTATEILASYRCRGHWKNVFNGDMVLLGIVELIPIKFRRPHSGGVLEVLFILKIKYLRPFQL